MTAEITQCPQCGTRFKVTDAQLDAHDGLVRCGRCHEVFNASEHLHDDQPNPQLSLPIEPELQLAEFNLTPVANVPELKEEPRTLAQQVRFVEEPTDEAPTAPRRRSGWLGFLLATVLALTLLAQAAYYFRVDLLARLPGLRPILAAHCSSPACGVALPRKADLINIESSELEADPVQTNVVMLHVLVHNRAPYAQAHPSLELTLTNLQDQAIARRVFQPADYLKNGDNEKLGIPTNRDFDIRLRLDTTDLNPSGYRLFLFYPK